jgi:hypothetical protein
MATVAKNIKVLVDKYDLTSAFKTAKPTGQADALESTTFGNITSKSFLAGLKKGALSLEGFFESSNITQDKLDDVLAPALTDGAAHIVTIGQEGATQAGRALLMYANETKYEVGTQVGQIVTAMAEFDSVYGYEPGRMLHVPQAETATGNDTSNDNGAASANGGVGHLHAPAVSGSGLSIVIKVQHSVDNAVWVDLITFTTIAAATPTSQRVEVAGTVNRYTRSTRTISGSSPSITYGVAFARR